MTLLQAEPTRETFWTVGPVGEALFYGLAAMAILVFCYGVYDRFARYARGGADPFDRLDDLPGRVVRASRVALSNEGQFDRDIFAGVMHAFILWGFLTLLIGTTILMVDMDIYRRLTGTSFFRGDFYLSYSFVMDALGFLFVVGVGMAIYRRYVVRQERLWGKHTGFEDDIFVWTLFVLGVGGYVIEGLRIVGTEFPEWETVSFVGYFVALVFDAAGVTPELAATLYWVGWWSHALVALGFVAFLPYAKPFHMISSFANVVARDEKAGKRLPGVPEDAAPDEIGYTGIEDLSWKQLLDTDACTKCGRCSSVCPAKEAGRPLDPRDVILDLKSYRESLDAGETEPMDIVADGGTSVIDAETMESCVACMACMDSCPVDIEHLSHFTEMNRRLTETGQMQEPVQEAMMNVFQNGNAFGDPARKRPAWTEELDFEVPDAREESVEFLWYVGDYPSYDERNRRVARSLARLFELAGVSYGILYEDEQNDGNDVRRVGEEGLYEMLVEDNAAAFAECDFEKVVCTDPHSYNTFENEYPEMAPDFDYPVYHYTQVVESLVEEGRLGLDGTELDYDVTYHDPCHLGRFNDEYDAPRELVRATGARLAEMPRNREDSFCCGGGGGGLWMDHDETKKPSEERLREALEDTAAGSAVEKFVVACPMCGTMYEDGRKTGDFEDDIEIIDVAELLVEALESKRGAAVAEAESDDDATPAASD
ncbi:heterodisulfide reductase-related iron-sulfur binding cluster [Halopelagius longus]|uniref:4Fe-4S dicluster domain-containing protein n=1 Tax=Halopelagius longus TaxID=1236180 RepID=A0A1H1EAA9_9EURY|nr:(Fe-S)-binding protein [Halopelagius longus]RDI71653.1 4Fe-4S dicluster domain-containing protein [Halopelagius longus]SDQ85096.1 Fe-S oxidoreductase [Halopelagius longus]